MISLDDIAKASSYTIESLQQLLPSQLDRLDFRGFPEVHGYDSLDVLIPPNKKYGKLNPPSQYLKSGHDIRRWRKLSRSDQTFLLDKSSPVPVTRDSSQRAERQSKR